MPTIHTKRRKRRRAKAVLKHGKNAVRKHARPGGRTGQIHARKPKAHAVAHTSAWPNPEPGIPPLGRNNPGTKDP